jgi:hypothetical protein
VDEDEEARDEGDEDDEGEEAETGAEGGAAWRRSASMDKSSAPAKKYSSLVDKIDSAGRLAEVRKKVLDMGAGGDCYLISLVGTFTPAEQFQARLLGAVASRGAVLTPMQLSLRLSEWSAEADKELIDQINTLPASGQPLSEFALPKKALTYCSTSLASKNLLDVQFRVQNIEEFNKHLGYLLPLIDLQNKDPQSLGALIRQCNRYLLLRVKTPLLDGAISSSVHQGSSPAALVLDNSKALMSQEKEERDPSTSQNCFVQAFQQLHTKESTIFRCAAGSDRVFQTSFVGESGIDAGGVFREGLSRITEDLFSEHFNLLLLCPNAQQAVHSNTEKFVPNPQHNGSALATQMFEFLGKLMALSIRTKMYLPFEFPPLIWKKLVGEAVDETDLAGIDAIVCKQLESVRAWDLDRFDPSKMRFEFLGSDKVERELVPGGRSMCVTYENRLQYCNAVVAAKLGEFDAAVEAMRRGVEEVIPSQAVLLFSGRQLEELVCGSPLFDLELWRKNTDASGVSPATVALFWRVMATLTQKELSGFVRFAWGRSRLPPAKEFGTKMRLTSGGSAVLPVSHTCFFSVELPEYRTEEAMRHGLLTAIHYGVGGILNG